MKIDINDLNYIYSSEDLNPPFRKGKYNINILYFLFIMIKTYIKSIIGLYTYLTSKSKKRKNVDYLFYSYTSNNRRALKPIQNKISNSVLLEFEDIQIDIKKSRRFGLIIFFKILYRCIKYKGYLKKAYINEFEEYCFTYGYYKMSLSILNNIKPKMILIANDHNAIPRCFFRAAQKLNIKTVYIQHASVSENFPPLEFDYAFLDGKESYEKYINNKKCISTIFLSGNPRFDIIKSQINKNNNFCKEKVRIGIAINLVDSIEKVISFIKLINKSSFEITLRPHASINFSFVISKFRYLKCNISNPEIENPFIFIDRNDIIISGESSIHLDAVLSGKISLYYNFSDNKILDWYGYLKNELIRDITSNPEFFLNNINCCNQKNKIEINQYYVANYLMPYWGNASELISRTLLSINKINKIWREIDGVYYIKNNK